jgi:glycosyltransferase involved in cell wall biosynthesis
MKVVVDYHLAGARESGMARYIRETLRYLQKENPSIELVLVDYEDMRVLKSVPAKILAIFKEMFKTQVTIPWVGIKSGASCLYIPNPPSPVISLGKKVVVNIPDLSFLAYEKKRTPIVLYAWFWNYISAHTATCITTFSENSKRDIVKYLHASPDRVTIVPLGVDPQFYDYPASPNAPQTRTKFGINRPYILSVLGAFISRKNANDLIDAYVALPPEHKKATQLVFVGKKGDRYYEALCQYLKSKNITEDIVFTGKTTEEELMDLYAGAKVFAFPSLYEGFGMPPIEAMAVGVPTVVYNNSSLTEIVKDAGLLVNNKDELREGIIKLLEDPKLREQLIAAGKIRARMYSWDKPAQTLDRLLKQVTGGQE